MPQAKEGIDSVRWSMMIGRHLMYCAVLCGSWGCGVRSHAPATPATVDRQSSYIDLRAGWRLRVITPLLKSGGYQVAAVAAHEQGGTITVTTGADFGGYETAYYAIDPHGATGVRIRFSSAQIFRDGKALAVEQPALPLFQLPRSIKHVRLLFLARASQADHNMAVLGASKAEDLASLTNAMQSDPTSACRRDGKVFCGWIPSGIAVRAEALQTTSNGQEWAPAK